MIESRGRVGLALEPRREVGRRVGLEQLERHLSAEREVQRAVDLAHAAVGEPLEDLVAIAEDRAWTERLHDPRTPGRQPMFTGER